MDRWLGGVLVALGVSIAATAHGFSIGFLVDPLGPKALPFLVAGLFVLGGSSILVQSRRTDRAGSIGGDQGLEAGMEPEGESQNGGEKAVWKQVGSVGILLGMAALFPILGFLLPTILATAGLARLFGSRWLQGLAVGVVLGLGLYVLFAWGFDLDLPVGSLFRMAP